MKQFVSFSIFYFLVCYYGKKVPGTALNNQMGDNGAGLKNKSGDGGKLLKGQISDPDAYRNVVRRFTNTLLHIIIILKI